MRKGRSQAVLSARNKNSSMRNVFAENESKPNRRHRKTEMYKRSTSHANVKKQKIIDEAKEHEESKEG